ncbi:MAG TPA: DUF4080 domain-containing protein [Erysipelotrichaceae bacterium]|nr:DUF4080 domain-containing protein [Erysipelotrichaceae bacterium]
MRVLLTTFNSSYIHKNLALRWLYVAKPEAVFAKIKEFTIKDKVENVIKYVVKHNFNVVAISTYIWNANETKDLVLALDKLDKDIKVILGGPEVTYENDEWFDLPIDGIILGEGEKVLWDYILEGDTTYVKKAKGEFKPIRKEDIAYLETLPSPYNLPIDQASMDKQYLYVEASRGCPFKCSYCLSSLDNQVRFFSMEYINQIFEDVKHYKINQVKFLDRTFNAHKKRTKQLYAMLENYPNVESFQVEIVADKLSSDLIEMIIDKKNRHRFRYEIGIQSFNQKTLESVDRSQDNDLVKEIMKIFLANDVVIHADLIAGLPYEGLESFKDSFNQLAEIYPTELQLGILKLLKGTKMKREGIELGYLYDKNPPYEVYKTPWLNKDEMDYINVVAKGVDRTLNRQLFYYTIRYLSKAYKANMFLMYYDIGMIFEELGISYQKHDVFSEVYNKFKHLVDQDVFKTILNIDYFFQEKQKPKILFKEERAKDLNKRIVAGGYFSQQEVYSYGRVFKDYRVEDGVILALFNAHQNPCDIYTINFKEKSCQKISF